jgi:outer membrane protein assembly factor BamB
LRKSCVIEPQSTDLSPSTPSPAPIAGPRGRWKWGFAILLIACIAQGILWAKWWEDPTHFKMSILFVWPAALFCLTIWWVFFSGWSWLIRLGSVAIIAASIAGFLAMYRLEWDGDMVPRRFVLRSKPRAEDVARQFLKQQPNPTPPKSEPDDAAESANAPALVDTDGDWPGFRGPRRDGIVRGGSLRRNWEKSPPREIWRHPVGRGWSAFSVVGKYAFTQEQRDEFECVVAYDVATGEQIWVHSDKTVLSIVDANGGPGPHGTPQFDEGLIYTLGGTGILNCLEAATGKLIWTANILHDAGGDKEWPMPQWGVSNSPLIVDNLVIVIPGGSSTEGSAACDKGVAAYEKKTGKLEWAAGKHKASYGSPRLETIGEVRQVLIPNANGLSGHSAETGQELWFFPLENDPEVNSTMPWLLDGDSLLFGTGYGIGSVRIDVKMNARNSWTATKRWASNRFRPKFNDFVVREGHAYGLDDGTLSCLDVETGKIKWKNGRYGYGQLLLVDDVLLVIGEDGDLMLTPATPDKPERLASFKVFDSGFCWNHLALVRGRLFARNANEAVCLDVGEE